MSVAAGVVLFEAARQRRSTQHWAQAPDHMTSAETHAPVASICIPTYNGDRYLEAAIDSATSQTFSNVEILIVDDGSHDRTLDIADQFALGDPRVRVVRNATPLGLPGNWDRCVDLAQGAWVKFLFQDDVLSPTCVERLHAAVRPGVDLVVCRRAAVAEPGVADAFAQEYATYVATYDISRRFPRTRSSALPNSRHTWSTTPRPTASANQQRRSFAGLLSIASEDFTSACAS